MSDTPQTFIPIHPPPAERIGPSTAFNPGVRMLVPGEPLRFIVSAHNLTGGRHAPYFQLPLKAG